MNNATNGPLYGFNVTSGGSNWLGFPAGSATFTFDQVSHAFGFYATGLQGSFGARFDVTYDNGSIQTIHLPINANGGASYFGFTDAQGFKSVTINRPGDDAWGIDNVTYSFSSAVPEPATWAMMIIGFGAVGSMVRTSRRRNAFSAA